MKSPEFRVALMLGGNVGETRQFFNKAIISLSEMAGQPERLSGIYISDPWGKKDQPDFLNQAVVLKTRLAPEELLEITKSIEQQLGRVKRVLNGPREIDIDILLYGDLIYSDQQLEIPHPRFHLRRFNLLPLAEIIPDWVHPVFHKSIATLLENCNDPLHVVKIEQS